MQAGEKNYLTKDFGFYDVMATAAVGVNVIAVYEALKRNVSRKPNSRTRREDPNKLFAFPRQRTIAAMTGLSLRSVHRAMNDLRKIGWVVSRDPKESKGGSLLYELGVRYHGVEVYYADIDLKELYDTVILQTHADRPELERKRVPCDLTLERRLEIAKWWYHPITNEDTGLESIKDTTLCQAVIGVMTERHTPYATVAHINIQNINTQKIEIPKEIKLAADAADGREFNLKKSEKGSKESRTDPIQGDLPGVQESDSTSERTGPAPKVATREPSPKLATKDPDLSKRRDRSLDDHWKGKNPQEAMSLAKARANERREKQMQKARIYEERLRNLKGTGKGSQLGKRIDMLQVLWKKRMKELFPELKVAKWDGRQIGQMKKLLEHYSVSEVETGIVYALKNWKEISKQFFGDKRQGLPTVGMLLRFHDTLIPMALVWGKHLQVMEEWDAFVRDDPYADPPSELVKRYETAKAEMDKVGVIVE